MTTRQRGVTTPLGPATVLVSGQPGARGTLVLTHGAGGGLSAADLRGIATTLPEDGWAVALVHQAWSVAGRRMPPPPAAQDAAWLPIVTALRRGRGALPGPLVVGGRSNGARVACRTAHLSGASAVLALAFPLHPPGRPAMSRAEELRTPPAHGIPVYVMQGATDPFGTAAEVRRDAGPATDVVEVPGGHSFARPITPVVEAARAALARLAAGM